MKTVCHLLICLTAMAGLFLSPPITRAGDKPATTQPGAPDTRDYVLHLPGVAGPLTLDTRMTRGLCDKRSAEVVIYDWTRNDPGYNALIAYARNQEEAQTIADKIAEQFHAHPDRKIYVTAHSGGTGLAVWALEKLPADVQVESLLLLSSALSPEYDLTKALSHVRNQAFAFTSMEDEIVLGVGTTVMGTIDGQHCEAAGKIGFIRPEGADAKQYQKLVECPYQDEWLKFDNLGDHIGTLEESFAKNVVAPILFGEVKAGKPAAAATTQPVKKS